MATSLQSFSDVDRTRFLPKLITAACTLHNFCIYSHDEIEYFLDPDDDDDGDANHFVNIFANDNTPYSKMAANKLFFCLHVN